MGIKSEATAQTVVEKILDDLTGRRGFRHEWEQIDEDIQEEIKVSWTEIVADVIEDSYENSMEK